MTAKCVLMRPGFVPLLNPPATPLGMEMM